MGILTPHWGAHSLFLVGYGVGLIPVTVVMNLRCYLEMLSATSHHGHFQIPVQEIFSSASLFRLLLCPTAHCMPTALCHNKHTAASSAYSLLDRYVGLLLIMICAHPPHRLACLFIKLFHNYFLHQPAWISFPLNISLPIEFLLQRGRELLHTKVEW